MSEQFDVTIHKSVKKILSKLPKELATRITRAIDHLAMDPRPMGCKKLTGYDNLYRIRVGEWRVSYAVEDDRLVILILELTPRGGAYRKT